MQQTKISKKFRKFHVSVKDKQHRLILDILYETGCNVSELVRIKKKDIVGSYLLIPAKNTKNNIERRIELSRRVLERIKHIDSEYIFPGRQSVRITKRRVEQILLYYSAKSKFKLTPRTIRKIYLKKQIRDCRDTKELRKQAGLKCIRKPAVFDAQLKKGSLRDRLIFRLINETGLKTGVICRLKIKDISKLKISQNLKKTLAFFARDRTGYLFPGQRGQISPRRVQQILKKYTKLSPNQIRRSFATREYKSGTPLSEIRRNLGIKNLDAFNYGFVDTNGKRM